MSLYTYTCSACGGVTKASQPQAACLTCGEQFPVTFAAVMPIVVAPTNQDEFAMDADAVASEPKEDE